MTRYIWHFLPLEEANLTSWKTKKLIEAEKATFNETTLLRKFISSVEKKIVRTSKSRTLYGLRESPLNVRKRMETNAEESWICWSRFCPPPLQELLCMLPTWKHPLLQFKCIPMYFQNADTKFRLTATFLPSARIQLLSRPISRFEAPVTLNSKWIETNYQRFFLKMIDSGTLLNLKSIQNSHHEAHSSWDV